MRNLEFVPILKACQNYQNLSAQSFLQVSYKFLDYLSTCAHRNLFSKRSLSKSVHSLDHDSLKFISVASHHIA